VTLDFLEWKHVCEADRYLRLKEFLKRHRKHEIMVIEEAIHSWPVDPDELRKLCGGDARVEFLDKDSPYWADNDGLYFEITPLTKKGESKRPEPIHVVVYSN